MKKFLISLLFLCIIQITYTKTVFSNDMLKQNPILEKLLYYGTLAPSSHNAQMWKIKILSENEFLIIFDKEKSLKFVDPDNREAFISIGAFLANVIKGAEIMEVELDYKIYDEIRSDNSVVYVSFTETETVLNTDSIQKFEKLLLKRKTSKEKFSKKKIPDSVLNEITAGYENNIIYFTKGTSPYEYIKENTIKAYEVQGKNQDKRNELSEWFRFSDKEAESKKDGFSAEMLGMNSFKKFFFYNFYNKEKIRDIKFLKSELKLIKVQADSADGFLLITAKDNSLKENIKAGIILENIWLNAADKNIKIQPLSQILEEEPYKSNIRSDLNINKEIKMLLRIGYSSDNKTVQKIRKNITDILDNTEIKNNPEGKL